MTAKTKKPTLGARIRAAREAKGWSQGDLATAIGLSQPSISLIERDEQRLSVAAAARVIKTLKIDISVAELAEE